MKKKKKKKGLCFTRSKHFVKHHNVNRCRGGNSTEENLIVLEKNREKAWHFLFNNLTFGEVALLLLRVEKMKRKKAERVKELERQLKINFPT